MLKKEPNSVTPAAHGLTFLPSAGPINFFIIILPLSLLFLGGCVWGGGGKVVERGVFFWLVFWGMPRCSGGLRRTMTTILPNKSQVTPVVVKTHKKQQQQQKSYN